MKLAYQAVDKSGKPSRDVIEAVNEVAAREELRQRGLFVTSISASDNGSVAGTSGPRRGGGRRLKDAALWSRQLCVLVRSGTPLAQAMAALEKQTPEGAWRNALVELRQHVEEGSSLSEAMSRTSGLFDDVSRSLVAAGESTGQLGAMLDRLACLGRQQLKVRRSIRSAMVYPALLILVGCTVTLVMLLGVLPRFAELFESLNAPIPPTTSALMVISGILQQYWWALLIGVAGVAGAIKLALSGPSGRRWLDSFALRLPFAGHLVRSLATARIARLLGVMLDSKVPLLEALQLTRSSTGNVIFGELIAEAAQAATTGDAVSTVFGRSELIPASVAEAIRHGERNGQIGPILLDMADFLDEENEVIVRTVMSLLEPLILIALGLVVGFIALSLFIPLFDLTSMTGAA